MFTIIVTPLEGSLIRSFHSNLLGACEEPTRRSLISSVIDTINRSIPDMDTFSIAEQPSVGLTFNMNQKCSILAICTIWVNALHGRDNNSDELLVLNAAKRIINILNATSTRKVRTR